MNTILDCPVENVMTYNTASTSKRLANYVIDYIGTLFFEIIVGSVLGVIHFFLENETILVEFFNGLSGWDELALSIFLTLSYYILSEYFFNGKTLGKMITGTRAVTEDNDRMDFSTVVIRSLCRIIPFERFSYLMNSPSGWHDTLSKTKVIEDRGWTM